MRKVALKNVLWRKTQKFHSHKLIIYMWMKIATFQMSWSFGRTMPISFHDMINNRLMKPHDLTRQINVQSHIWKCSFDVI